jgi:hypothetical protein
MKLKNIIYNIIAGIIVIFVGFHILNYSKLGWYGGLLEKTKQVITLPWSLI